MYLEETRLKINMDRRATSNYRQPIMLIISNSKTKLTLSSSISAFFDRFQVIFQKQKTLSWIQQHQPDLIILDLEKSDKLLPLVTTLKLDWLTRDIPIIAIVDSADRQLCLSANLNDACLSKPYSVVELEQKICSLISICNCKISDKAV